MAMQPQIKKLSPLIPFFNGEPSSVSVASEETGSLSSEDTLNNAAQSWELIFQIHHQKKQNLLLWLHMAVLYLLRYTAQH